jgi:ribonuclease HI
VKDFFEQPDYHIYVDGSKLNGSVGYGVVVLMNGDVINEIHGIVPENYVQGTNQVAGELYAVRKAIEWCWQNSVNQVSVFYDYDGVEKWATGEWKTKQTLTQEYDEFVNESGIIIKWQKVTSHTGNIWNERADELAKTGAGIETIDETPADLKTEAEGFVKFLESQGFKVVLKGIHNQNCAKIQLSESNIELGYINIYNTKKEGLLPRYHELKDSSNEAWLDSLWKDYRYGEKQLFLL